MPDQHDQNEMQQLSPHFLDQLRVIYGDSIIPHLARKAECPDAPDEGPLALAVGALLHEEVQAGHIRIDQRRHVMDLRFSAVYLELDIVVEQAVTGVTAAIEVRGYSAHDRSPAEFDYSHRRRRELELAGYKVLQFTASEVRENTWSAAIDVLRFLTEVWHIAPIKVPPGALALARRFAGHPEGVTSSPLAGETGRTDETPGSRDQPLLARIAAAAAAWPLRCVPAGQQERDARAVHPRAYEPWRPDEQDLLRDAFYAGRSVEEIASALRRPPGAVRIRAVRLGLLRDRSSMDHPQ